MKCVLVLGLFAGMLLGQAEKVRSTLDRTIPSRDVAVSPDGKRVAWAQGPGDEKAQHLHLAAIGDGGRPIRVAMPGSGKRVDSEPAWSPDSKNVVFLSSSGDDQNQLWTVTGDGTGAQQRSRLKGYVARARWSHSGKQIAFLYVEGASGGGPLVAAPVRTGVIDTEFHNQRIAIVDVASGKVRQISPADLNIYDFDWSPDDETFVTTAAPGPGDNNWWIAQIYTVRIASGEARAIYKPKFQVALPRWSPDGKSIAFIEGLMSDEGFHGGDLFTLSVGTEKAVNRTPNRKASPSSFFWVAPDRILLTEWSGGGSAISELSLRDGEVRTRWNGTEALWAFGNFPTFSASRDGSQVAAIRSSWDGPPEVWAGPPGEWKQITKNNAGLLPPWGKGESVDWTNDGFRVQGWLLKPRTIEAGRKYPLIVEIHGGPSNSAKQSWPTRSALTQMLSSEGYFVFLPNPRGSYGQGESFTTANVKDFGHGDLRDILAGLDAVLAKYPVDPKRLGVTGWSYGGYMTMWTVTQTNRFRAAMAGAGIANWQSYYGQNLIDQWMVPFFGASVYDDPAAYRKSSPIEFVKNVKTPTLVLVGERDAECPAPQSYEFWHALRALGVKTQLVVYGGEGHMFVDPKNKRDLEERTLAWFRDNL